MVFLPIGSSRDRCAGADWQGDRGDHLETAKPVPLWESRRRLDVPHCLIHAQGQPECTPTAFMRPTGKAFALQGTPLKATRECAYCAAFA
eukprot:8916845-Heterocapsa_arctica.AAC.1